MRKGDQDYGATLGYVDFAFAYGLACRGDREASLALADAGRQSLKRFDPVSDRGIAHRFLLKAFEHRIATALKGKLRSGPLPSVLMSELAIIEGNDTRSQNNPYGIAHYAISRMLDESRLLGPQEAFDPQLKYTGDPFDRAILDLRPIHDPQGLTERIRELYKKASHENRPKAKLALLAHALPLSARVGEQFALELLTLVPDVLLATGLAAEGLSADQRREADIHRAQLLERSMRTAAHFSYRDVLQHLVDHFFGLLTAMAPEQRHELVNVVARQCLRSLRKLGLLDEIDKLLRRMQDVILSGETVAAVRQRYEKKPDLWAKALQGLLNLAGGWLMIGLTDQAAPILDDARRELTEPGGAKLHAKDVTALAQAYVTAVGQGPAEAGLPRIAELFRKLDPKRVTNTFASGKFFSRFHLNIVEDTVLAVVHAEGLANRLRKRTNGSNSDIDLGPTQ